MVFYPTKPPLQHRAVLDRFVAACRADGRIVAAFLGGSFARQAADEFSDLDLYLITTDEDFDEFSAQRAAFVHRLGDPVFVEDFDFPNFVFFILADGIEAELGIGRASQFHDIHHGPFQVLVDKQGVLAGVEFPLPTPGPAEQAEKLRRLVVWFWHDVSHFTTALARGQLWWAQGQLEILRRSCISLARLRNNFADPAIGEEAYYKLDRVLPAEQLAALPAASCPLDADAMLEYGMGIIRFYKEVALPLAREHGIAYPEALERILVRRLEKLHQASI